MRTLGEVPPELALTAEYDGRLAAQAHAVPMASVVRLLDLLAGAREATRNGADARTQLELALVKATAPQVDASTKALLARIDRLEAQLAAGAPAPPSSAAPLSPAPVAVVPAPAAQTPPPAPQPAPDPPPEPDALAPPPEPAPEPDALAPPPTPAGPEGNGHVPEESFEVPEVEPVVSVPPAAGAPAFASVSELWPAVLDAVRAENGMLAACLGSAQPVALDGTTLQIAFPASEGFAHKKCADSANRELVARALRSVTGQELTPDYELRDELPIAEEPPPLSEDEVIARFKEAFDAEELTHDEDAEAT